MDDGLRWMYGWIETGRNERGVNNLLLSFCLETIKGPFWRRLSF